MIRTLKYKDWDEADGMRQTDDSFEARCRNERSVTFNKKCKNDVSGE